MQKRDKIQNNDENIHITITYTALRNASKQFH